jgi:hypothetical protein
MKSIYPTSLDPLSQQITVRVTEADILRGIKTQALFFDIVSPSVSHILSSKRTYNALQRQPELLREGIIQPQIPKSISNIDEYLEWIDIEGDIEWLKRFGIHLTRTSYLTLYLNRDVANLSQTTATGDPQRILRERVNFLDRNVKKFFHYDQPAVADLVKESVIKHLDPKTSSFSKNFKNWNEVERIKSLALEALEKRGVLDRGVLFTCIDTWGLKDRIILKKVINLIYFTCGAIITDHMLDFDTCYVPLLSKELNDLNSIWQKSLITKAAFDALLGHLKVDPFLIEALDVDSLKRLRKWPKGTFRKTIWNFVEKWQRGVITSKDVKEKVKPEIKNLNEELSQALQSEVNKQKKTYKEIEASREEFKKLMEILMFLGTTLTSVGIANLSSIIIASAALRLASDPVLNYLLRKKANFIVFAKEIKNAAVQI